MNGGGAGFLTAIPDFRPVIPHIRPVIPDSYPVIPAKAGIHSARPRENGDCERRWDARAALSRSAMNLVTFQPTPERGLR